ncbi:TRAP transporter permease [Chloroflexota bacterium]
MESFRIDRPLDKVMVIVAAAMVVYHLVSTFHLLADPWQHQNYHLGFAFLLVFLAAVRKGGTHPYVPYLLVLLTLVAVGYIAIFHSELQIRQGFPTTPDMVIGVILMVLAFEATRRSFGLLLPIFGLLAITYVLVGPLIPGNFGTVEISFRDAISKMAISSGIYGNILGISANYIFLFILFGAAMGACGATRFFTQIGRVAGNRLSGGGAMTAVVTSGLLGMITGSAAANVVTTGSFTIPTMKRIGYKPEQAGAIEAAASTGGQIMPPVMGAAAFLMVGFTDIPYIKIITVAAIPAILYFGILALYSQLNGMKLKLSPVPEKLDVKEFLLSSPLFIVPLIVLVILLIMGFTVMVAVSRSLLVLIALSLLRSETRLSFTEAAANTVQGALAGAQIGAVCAWMGIVVKVFTMTGLGVILPNAFIGWSGGNLAVLLVIGAVVSIVLGMGLPTSAVYILSAIVVAPALVHVGLDVLQAHFFVFYYACLNFITPPIAIVALIASKLAGAPFYKTAIEATKAALAGFVVPFLFILCPALLLLPQEPAQALTGIFSTVIILIALQVAICNYYFTSLSRLERLLYLLVALVLIAFMVTYAYSIFAVGLAVFIILTVGQARKRRSQNMLNRLQVSES